MDHSLFKMIVVVVIATLLTTSTFAQSWLTTGNSGTMPPTNFLGTTDAKSMVFKTNGKERLRIDKTGNVGIGTLTPLAKLDVGDDVLIHGITVGLGAAGFPGNTAIGNSALYSNTTGGYNVAIGFQALYYNTMGNDNTANGVQALYFNTTGGDNVANGLQALYSNTTGSYNEACGFQALYSNTTGFNNTANGYLALYDNSTGFNNTATGNYALNLNRTGNYNTANGMQSLSGNLTGSNNTATGFAALAQNSDGSNNTANGFQALSSSRSGSDNTAVGYNALYYNNSGYSNTACGENALFSNEGGFSNTASGYNALHDNSFGKNNTATGYNALAFNRRGENITGIGNNANVNQDGYSNGTAIGNNSIITASDQVRIGNNAITSIGGYTNWTNISDARVKKNIKQNVPGLVFINLLKPITYNYDLDAADKIVWPEGRSALKNHPQPEELQELDAQSRKEKEQITYTGFLAQDVESAAKSIGYDFSGVDAPKNDKDLYGLRYAEFVVPLVKAVQELDSIQKQEAKSQNDEIDSLKSEIENLKLIVSNLESTMSDDSKFLQMDSSGKTSNYTLQTANLYQNIPNPFNQQTIIRFNLPSQFSSAQITISNSAGAVLKNFNLSNGMNQIVLEANEFPAGSYEYSLLIDGKVVESRQMILTR